ncbi:ABC transporter substrate-binding protein [Paenibacillus sp. HB172176]|uniref:ABC transporter substrate-binding protein n=1 Tax=Paenibacillus sp. HB172176 TaxID=2493690 RepID=UPI001F0F7997|nr:ABC transporter substrate-binding protein [Paenibacillus sp. HB172176]
MSKFKMTKRSYVGICSSVLAASLLLSACGSNDNGNTVNNQSNNAANNSAATTEPTATATEAPATERTLTDGLGHEVKVPANPQHIIASYLEDYLVALGVKPAAQWSTSKGVQDYLQKELEGIPTIPSDLPYEAVMSFEPDLIITGTSSSVEGDKYEQYNKIAPTYTLGDEVNSDWHGALLKIGEVLGMEDKAQEVLDAYNAKASDAKTKLQSVIPGESAAVLWYIADKFYMVSDTYSSGAVLYKDLGVKVPEVVKEISEGSTANWNLITPEKLAKLDADNLLLVTYNGSTPADLLNDTVYQDIPAVKNKKIYEMPENSGWLYYGPVASNLIIDDVLSGIVK